jgi:hypothetical protein
MAAEHRSSSRHSQSCQLQNTWTFIMEDNGIRQWTVRRHPHSIPQTDRRLQRSPGRVRRMLRRPSRRPNRALTFGEEPRRSIGPVL